MLEKSQQQGLIETLLLRKNEGFSSELRISSPIHTFGTFSCAYPDFSTSLTLLKFTVQKNYKTGPKKKKLANLNEGTEVSVYFDFKSARMPASQAFWFSS